VKISCVFSQNRYIVRASSTLMLSEKIMLHRCPECRKKNQWKCGVLPQLRFFI